MVRHKLDSVNDFARQGYNLRIRCLGCAHEVEASAIEMMAELHRRRKSRGIEALEERMKCGVCGHRGATISPCEASI